MKINLTKKIKILLVILLFVFSLSLLSPVVSFAASSQDTALNGLQNLSSGAHGIITCDPYAPEGSIEQCTPANAIKLLSKLAQIYIYITIISLVLFLIISGVAYVFKGNNPGYLIKWKKRIQNALSGMLIIVIGMGLVLGILAALGMQTQVLDFLKGILAFNDFSPFTHALAADDISSISDSLSSQSGTSSVGYINFFPNQSVPSLLLLAIKFIINYIAAPALVGAAIWSGFLFVKAQGNPESLKKAKAFALRVVIGIAIAAAASGAVSVLINTLSDIAGK